MHRGSGAAAVGGVMGHRPGGRRPATGKQGREPSGFWTQSLGPTRRRGSSPARRARGTGRGISPPEYEERRTKNGNWYGQVVQRREGLWVHHPGRRWRGCLLPLQRDPGGWLQEPFRGPEGGVRGRPWSEGPAGPERPPHLSWRRGPTRERPGTPEVTGPFHFPKESLELPQP